MTETDIRMAAEDCYALIRALFQRFLNPGVALDAP